ncbi:MAG: BamA/TamA family outer membrane protein [Pseudomonadota bacterium]
MHKNRSFIVAAFAATLFFSHSFQAVAQEGIAPRAFDQIEIVGNTRFRDGDILATSDLAPGVAYGEADLIAAVEALEFTGEFRSVRIFSRGNILVIEVDEEPAFSGNLTFGLGYETDTGVFGSVGLRLDDALGNGSTLGADLTLAGEFVEAAAFVSNPSFWGQGRAGGVRLAFADYDYDDTLFDYRTYSVSPYLAFGLAGSNRGEVRLTALGSEISDVDAAASPIILAEAGDRLVVGPGVSLIFGAADALSRGWALRLDQDIFGGDAELSRTQLRLSGQTPFAGGTTVRTRIELAAVAGFNGSETIAADRFTLGGSAMRGFARGGITPRDVCPGCGAGGADVVTDLGGEFSAVARTELVVPLFEDRPMLEPFLFADVGSVWGLDRSTPPAGIVDDTLDWRSSAGLGLAIATPLGRFSVTYAAHIDSEALDDEAELNLSFAAEF